MILIAFAGASAVAIGAFGAHGLDSLLAEAGMDASRMNRRLQQFDTGARYHLIHAVVLLSLAGLPVSRGQLFRLVVMLMFLGIVLFSGSLYALVLTDTPRWGAVTPLGGLSWIIAWVLIAFMRREEPAVDGPGQDPANH